MTVAITPTHDEVTAALTIPRFRAWLESKDPEGYAGELRACGRCPIAKFLRAQFPGVEPLRIFSHTVRWGERDAFIPAPKWVLEFVARADANATEWITPVHCLRILAWVEKALA